MVWVGKTGPRDGAPHRRGPRLNTRQRRGEFLLSPLEPGPLPCPWTSGLSGLWALGLRPAAPGLPGIENHTVGFLGSEAFRRGLSRAPSFLGSSAAGGFSGPTTGPASALMRPHSSFSLDLPARGCLPSTLLA